MLLGPARQYRPVPSHLPVMCGLWRRVACPMYPRGHVHRPICGARAEPRDPGRHKAAGDAPAYVADQDDVAKLHAEERGRTHAMVQTGDDAQRQLEHHRRGALGTGGGEAAIALESRVDGWR